MKSHEIDYKIYGDDMQYIEIELEQGKTVIGEAGAMMYMHEGIKYEVKMGDGQNTSAGLFDKVFELGKRILTNESLFLTHYTNHRPQKGAFLCAANGTNISVEFARSLGSGFFGGEGFILQKLEGDGKAFIHACGGICLKKLSNETIRVDTGSIVAFTKGISLNVEMVQSFKSMLFSGEGLFLATLSGSGYVWL